MENNRAGVRDRLTPVLILAVIGILIFFLRLVAINHRQGDYDACWAYGTAMFFASFSLTCFIPIRKLRIAKGLLVRFAAVIGLCAAGTAILFFGILWKPPHYFDSAVERGQVRRIRRFLEKYPVAEGQHYEWELDSFDMAELEYQLCEAVEEGHLELIDVFLEYGVDLSNRRNEQYSPLQTAMRYDSRKPSRGSWKRERIRRTKRPNSSPSADTRRGPGWNACWTMDWIPIPSSAKRRSFTR